MVRSEEASRTEMCHVSTCMELVDNIIRRAAEAKRNVDDGKTLERLVWKIVPFLYKLGNCESTDRAEASLRLLVEALRATETAVEESCNQSLFIAMLFAGRHHYMLKSAAALLEHALGSLPISIISKSAELQASLEFLRMELLGTLFVQTAATKQQMLILQSQIEKEFQNFSEELDADRLLLTQMTREYVHSVKDLRQDLEVLKRYKELENVGKKRSVDVIDVQQAIDVVTSFILDPSLLSRDRQEKAGQSLRCPISKEPMKDPVILKGSGVTYDRVCIVKWMKSGKRTDPFTEIEVKSGQLLLNPNPNPNINVNRLITKTVEAARVELKQHYIISRIRSQFTKLRRSSSDGGGGRMLRRRRSSRKKTEESIESRLDLSWKRRSFNYPFLRH